jgi:hypothetical protein
VKKRLIPIYSVLVVAIILLAAFVPSCGPSTGTIEVKATLCGVPWQGAVNYTLTLSGGTSPVTGGVVPTTHSSMTPGTWTCAYDAGGPAGAFLKSIKPLASQSLVAGGTITFTLDFELNQDAVIEFTTWTVSGQPWQGSEILAEPCMVIDSHFRQWVNGCEGYNVTMNETSWLKITQIAGPGPVVIYVVDDPCAVNKTPAPREKVSQVPTFDGVPTSKGQNITLVTQTTTTLDVHTQWKLVKCVNYTKNINWFGIWVGAYEPGLHPCVLFELIVPLPGQMYQFTIQTGADVAIVGDTDVDPGNNHAESGTVTLTILS